MVSETHQFTTMALIYSLPCYTWTKKSLNTARYRAFSKQASTLTIVKAVPPLSFHAFHLHPCKNTLALIYRCRWTHTQRAREKHCFFLFIFYHLRGQPKRLSNIRHIFPHICMYFTSSLADVQTPTHGRTSWPLTAAGLSIMISPVKCEPAAANSRVQWPPGVSSQR